ncbi:MAG: hypothetical protein AAGK04_04290 [Planctomycetota bacterium]
MQAPLAYHQAAQSHIERLVRSQALEPMSAAPRVTLRIEEPGKITMLARVLAPDRHEGRVEQAILRWHRGHPASQAGTDPIDGVRSMPTPDPSTRPSD